MVLPPSGNAHINNHYIDSVVNARTTTVVNNFQNQLADSSRMLRIVIRDSSLSLMRDSIVSIIRDSATTIQQSISTLPAGTCYASCSSVDSLRRRQDSAQRAFDSIVSVQSVVLHRNDSVINVQRLSIRHYDSIIRTFDSVVTVYDSLIVRIKHVCDSVSGGNSGSVEITDGALPGVFSVSPTKKVRFSQGNLQYQASTNTWRFAEHQYDYVGGNGNGNVYENGVQCDNRNSSSLYGGWIDVFGWGTSGYHDPSDIYNVRYMPYETGNTQTSLSFYNNYGYGPSNDREDHDLTGSSAHYDWGVHNAISNGGGAPGQWRTLTGDEWVYLIKTRTTSSVVGGTTNARFCKATVYVGGKTISGIILFPDSYVHPTGICVPNSVNSFDADYSYTFTYGQWNSMEAAGCMFFVEGAYWSSTNVQAGSYNGYLYLGYAVAYNTGSLNSNVTMQIYHYNRSHVRLVQDVSE